MDSLMISEMTIILMMYGTLLNEPNQDYGVHEGDKIGFVPIAHGLLQKQINNLR